MCADVVMWARGLPLNKADLNSRDFVINRFLLNSSNLDIVRYCQEQFCFELPSVILVVGQNLKLNLVTFCQINISNSLLCNI